MEQPFTKDKIQEILSKFNDDDIEKNKYFFGIIMNYKETLKDLPLSMQITDIVTDTLLNKSKEKAYNRLLYFDCYRV